MASQILKIEQDGISAVPFTDEKFSEKAFKASTKVKVVEKTEEQNEKESSLIFDLKGVDYSFANALRRLIISEVETVAFEKVNMFQNTSVIDDETLSHRLGLIPINVDALLLKEKKEDEPFDEFNCLLFKLHVKCDSGRKEVYSSDLTWHPLGDQKTVFSEARPVFEDILIAKLAEGQVNQ